MKLSLAFLASVLALAPNALALWPQPAEYKDEGISPSLLRISPKLNVKLAQGTDQSRVSPDLKAALGSLADEVAGNPFWKLEVDRGESLRVQVVQAPVASSVEVTILELLKGNPNTCGQSTSDNWSNKCSISSRSLQKVDLSSSATNPKLDITKDTKVPTNLGLLDSEAYSLVVPRGGAPIKIRAYTALGAFRALQTLKQLIYSLPPNAVGKGGVDGNNLFVQNVPITIKDRPAYPYRGLLLDTSRNWFPLETIRDILTGMASVKMNQFHWHATDTASWPLQFFNDVELATLGQTGSYGWTVIDGKAHRMVYSEESIKNVTAFAAQHGINVIIETDMPSHMMAGVNMIENKSLTICGARANWKTYGQEPPTGQLNLVPTPASTGVPDNIAKFTNRLLAKISYLTRGPYASSGGDEPNLNCWGVKKESDIDASVMKPFMYLVTKAYKAAGKLGMVWQEMATVFPETAQALAPGSLVAVWKDPVDAATVLQNAPEVNIVMAPYKSFYLDCGGPAWLGNSTDPNWCPAVGWQNMYAFSPEDTINQVDSKLKTLPSTSGKPHPAASTRIVGGEAALWTEQTDDNDVIPKIWPRAAAAAEIFWTGASYKTNQYTLKRSSLEALPRILELKYRMNANGIKASAIQPMWCAFRPTACNWY